MKDYYTCAQNAEYEFVEKKSRFIAHCCSVCEYGDAEETIAHFRKKFWDARHNCYAFRVNNTERSSDDGEPSGTAGVPILNVLRHNRMMNVLIVVTRYFGGVLLGTGGLTRAYSKAAAEALKSGGILWMRPCVEMHAEITYSDYNLIERFFRDAGIKTDTEFYETVRLSCYVPDGDMISISDKVFELTEGRSRMAAGKKAYVAFPVDCGTLRMEE